MTTEHGLTERQLRVMRDILAPCARGIERGGLFGSCAVGTARPNSDADLVLYGPISEASVDRIWTSFDASELAITIDVRTYALITHPPPKRHIDEVARVLFSGDALRSVAES